MSTTDKEPKRFYSRPRDQSLQAYRDFILDMLAVLNPEAKDEMTEEEWRQAWQQFWLGTSDAPGSEQP